MPKTIHGSVEATFEEWDVWHSVISFEELVDERSKVFVGKLFDVDNETAMTPVAARRGFPIDLADGTRILLRKTPNHFADTFASFEELQSYFDQAKPKEPWGFFWKLTKRLVESNGDRHVRLLVWFTSERDVVLESGFSDKP